MSHTRLSGQLAERKRNALESVWLGQLSRLPGIVVPLLQTSDDLYSYLLIDTRSGWQLMTSRVAQVIASLQQYINNILFGSEPGYQTIQWQQEHGALLEAWRTTDAQYDTWSASVLLAQYPENWLSPPLRLHQTGDFAQMVSDLNQGPLNDDTILAAVQGYLNRFEEVANLSVVSGYVAGEDLAQSDYYFLGRTASKPMTYWWRRCAMHMNTVTTMVPDSWSEWLKVDLPLGGDNVVGLPRLVEQNNRLHITWFERQTTSDSDGAGTALKKHVTLTARMAYLKFDGTWSVPQVLGTTTGDAITGQNTLYSKDAIFSTLALQHTDGSGNPFLFLGLYSTADAQCPTPGSVATDKAMVCALDGWMNVVNPDTATINRLFALYAAQTPAASNNNQTLANPQASSQQFLQRAEIIDQPRISTRGGGNVDLLGILNNIPTMQLALGTAEQKNSVILDATNRKNAKLIFNFTPGDFTFDLSSYVYGKGSLKDFNTPSREAEIQYMLIFFPGDTSRFSLWIKCKNKDDLTYLIENVKEVNIQANGGHDISASNISNDNKDRIILDFPGQYIKDVKENFNSISIVKNGGMTISGSVTGGGISKEKIAASDITTSIIVWNGLSGGTTEITGNVITGSDHVTYVIENIKLDEPSTQGFGLTVAVYLYAKNKVFELGASGRTGVLEIAVAVPFDPATDPMPVLDSYADPALGTAEFVHFDLKATAGSTKFFSPGNIRLNTLFARKLINAAESGIDHLLQWNTQLTPEPDMGPGCWLSLTLPAYSQATHGDSRSCSIILYTLTRGSRILMEDTLADTARTVRVFLPWNDNLAASDKDSTGATYRYETIYLKTAKSVFDVHKDALVVAFKKESTPIPPQVMNNAPWGPFSRYSGFVAAEALPQTTTRMDFSGANGLYFWELFWHTPRLVADTLTSRGQNSDALRWQQRLFDPSAINQGGDALGNTIPPYWKTVPVSPLYEQEDPSYAVEGPTDPDALAYAEPGHFRRAAYMNYIQTLTAMGDACYRQLTPDGLTQALQIYTRAHVLLGPRPDAGLVSPWTPLSLKDAGAQVPHGEHLAQFEQRLTTLPPNWKSYASTQNDAPSQTATSGAFHSPVNHQLLMLWDTLDARRHNLRHGLDINGNPLHLPLYAAPLNPSELLAGEVQGGTVAAQPGGGAHTIPPYRYGVMSEKARAAAAQLSDFGQQLLRYLETGDARRQEMLSQTQLADLWVFIRQAQQQSVDIADNTLATLTTSLAAAQQRHDYYRKLADGGRSALESGALSLQATSGVLMGTVAIPAIAAGIVALAPNIFGLADGGSDWAGPLKGIAESTMSLAFAGQAAAGAMSMQAEFDRRQEEWLQQAEQAQRDISTLNSQIEGQRLQIAAAKTAQALAATRHQQAMAMYRFLSSRFTGEALYQWLSGQLSALYYQAWDATLSLCLAAQACWQYETGDFTSTFITAAGWDAQHHGLMAGETLRLNLLQMDGAWLSRHTRALNITRSFSLREKLGEAQWAAFLTTLNTSSATFSLTEKDFDLDYPGHWLRQIAGVSVSLPALTGPYQNVRVTLTQTGSSLVLKPDLEAVKYLKDSTTGSGANVKQNLNASQEVALSGGLDDNGTFVMSANDGRYMPFEGTGAVSSWALAFPNPGSDAQKQVLSTLDDIVLTVHYTARDGGSGLAAEVLKLWS